MRKYRGIFIKRIDKTVSPDNNGFYPRILIRARVSNSIVPSHRMLYENKAPLA